MSFFLNAVASAVRLLRLLPEVEPGDRARVLRSIARHTGRLALRLPLRPRLLAFTIRGMRIEVEEFTGELANVAECFDDIPEELRPGDGTVIDVGANIGGYALALGERAGDRALDLWCFEPNPKAAARLRRNLAANRATRTATVHECALSARPGTVHLEVPLGYTVLSRFSDDPDLPAVPVRTLDEFADAIGEARLLKIDAEGHALPILVGADRLLARTRYVHVEVSPGEEEEVVGHLAAFGFQRLRRDRLTTGDFMLLLERNGTEVRDDHVGEESRP